MTTPHYDVAIATPGHSMKAEYVRSLVKTCAQLDNEGTSYIWLNKYSSFVPSARELTATDTYGHNWQTKVIGSGAFSCGKIFWIDSDIEWEVGDFLKLLDSPLDIISGLYQTSPDGTVAVNKLDEKGRPKKVNRSEFMLDVEPLEVGGVGFGFVAMKAEVFENTPRPWFLIDRVKWDEVDFECNVGEDYSFCNNAKRAGYKVMVDPMVRVKHHKETVYLP
jgi:hypothetical protein